MCHFHSLNAHSPTQVKIKIQTHSGFLKSNMLHISSTQHNYHTQTQYTAKAREIHNFFFSILFSSILTYFLK